MKTYIVAFSEDRQLGVELFADLDEARRYYVKQVATIYEEEPEHDELKALLKAGDMRKAYHRAVDLFGTRENSTVDNLVLEERVVPGASNLNVYTADFSPVFPVGCALVILAKDKKAAERVAAKTITHTPHFTVSQHPNKPGVVVYLSGDY